MDFLMYDGPMESTTRDYGTGAVVGSLPDLLCANSDEVESGSISGTAMSLRPC